MNFFKQFLVGLKLSKFKNKDIFVISMTNETKKTGGRDLRFPYLTKKKLQIGISTSLSQFFSPVADDLI